MPSGRGSGRPAIAVTSGMDRWLEAGSRSDEPYSEPGEPASELLPGAPHDDLNQQHAETEAEAESRGRRIELAYAPFPKQQEFHASPAKYRLFGGAAGPGKTKALLMEAILQAHENAGANTMLLRRTFPELEQSLLLYFRRDVPRELDRKSVV